MYIIESYPLAIILLIITMLCWGSWPNMQKLARKEWRFELFYWDYVIGIVLGALIYGLTIGSTGDEGRGFIADIIQADKDILLSAILGGVIFNLANILFMAAINYTGMSVAFPIGGGLAMVLGTLLNYFAAPAGDAILLFGGAAAIVLAIVMSTLADKKKKSAETKISSKGIILAVLAGIGFAFFFRFIAESMTTNTVAPEVGKLTSYSAIFIFGLGVFASNFLFNTYLIYKPFSGSSLTYADYFKGEFKDHIMGILGGVIWCTGLTLSLIASGEAGFAISWGLAQGNAMIAAIWGIFVWKEFKSEDKANGLLFTMFLLYIIGIILIILAK